MSFDAQRMYELLPAVYRVRDAERGEPLRQWLAVVAEQVAVLEENLDQLYDDQFIETCAEWAVPYIGDLIRYRSLHGLSEALDERALVGHMIALRRRKGTASVLEQLARDATGWNARVVEFFERLATTQYLNHLRPDNRYAVDLRDALALERLGTPFESAARTADVRRVASRRGKFNIPHIGIFLWRLQAYSASDAPAVAVDPQRYRFSSLNNDIPLFTLPETEDEITHLAEPINVPLPISRRVLADDLRDTAAPSTYYGPGKSILLVVNDRVIEAAEVIACDLSDVTPGGDWAHQPPDGKYAIDPVLGRIALPTDETQPARVQVTYHYGFSDELGGGEYARSRVFASADPPVLVPAHHDTIQEALNAVAVTGGVVEVTDNGRYEETLAVNVAAEKSVVLRAAGGRRPTVVLGGDFEIRGGADAEFELEGLLVSGAALVVPDEPDNGLRRLVLRHCTLVPGRSLQPGGEPAQPGQPSLDARRTPPSDPDAGQSLEIELERCISGPLRVGEVPTVRVTDSILDANDETAAAFSAPDGISPGGALWIEDTTVIGKVHTRVMRLASNTIFAARLAEGDTWTAPVRAEIKQAGCVRFSYVPPGSRLPRCYRCQPDLAVRRAIERALEANPELTPAERAQIGAPIQLRIQPLFNDDRYGQPAYAQLSLRGPIEIRRGAEDESEMGAFRKLYGPQRETNLEVRLDEFLPVGLEAGIFYET